MNNETQEFAFRLRSKLLLFFLFAFVGIPMLYSAYINFEVGEITMGSLMIVLFLLWGSVIFVATVYKIKITDSSIQRIGFLSPLILNFSEIDSIHFGSTFSNFYIQAGDSKMYLASDYENYEDLIHNILEKVKRVGNLDEVEISGKQKLIDQYLGKVTS